VIVVEPCEERFPREETLVEGSHHSGIRGNILVSARGKKGRRSAWEGEGRKEREEDERWVCYRH